MCVYTYLQTHMYDMQMPRRTNNNTHNNPPVVPCPPSRGWPAVWRSAPYAALLADPFLEGSGLPASHMVEGMRLLGRLLGRVNRLQALAPAREAVVGLGVRVLCESLFGVREAAWKTRPWRKGSATNVQNLLVFLLSFIYYSVMLIILLCIIYILFCDVYYFVLYIHLLYTASMIIVS